MRRDLLTVFGLGTLPNAPGTWASLSVAVLFPATVLLINGWFANLLLLLQLLLPLQPQLQLQL